MKKQQSRMIGLFFQNDTQNIWLTITRFYSELCNNKTVQ